MAQLIQANKAVTTFTNKLTGFLDAVEGDARDYEKNKRADEKEGI
jgi:hypothetical protein